MFDEEINLPSTVVQTQHGTFYFKEAGVNVDKDGQPTGILHREDGPAKIDSIGKHWYIDGKIHRDDDLPAIILDDGGQCWYKNGVLHRDDDLPAIIDKNGKKEWWCYGKRNRFGEPAIIHPNGSKAWFENNVFHNDIGPAIIHKDGSKEWHIRGIRYTEIEFNEITKIVKMANHGVVNVHITDHIVFYTKKGYPLTDNSGKIIVDNLYIKHGFVVFDNTGKNWNQSSTLLTKEAYEEKLKNLLTP